jgi:phosphopantetheine--protein transferase-like protein
MNILGDLVQGLPLVSREGDPRAIGPSASVWPEEREAVQRAVAKRQNEYFATRHLARLALAELAVPASPLLNHEDRSPRWPAGVLGSLTHTDVWCGVAVAKSEQTLRSVGIDMERLGSVSPDVAARIFSEWELSHANESDLAIRFSAKEAFYKAIYQFVRRYVGFREVEIELVTDRAFNIRVVSEVLAREVAPLKVTGLYATRGALCCTTVVVE